MQRSQAMLLYDKAHKKLPITAMLTGNPGVGKSIIGSSLAGWKAFHSGFSMTAVGVTSTEKRVQVNGRDEIQTGEQNPLQGVTLIDTPGLSDIKLRKLAAESIERALKQGGLYKIIFVVTLEAGRMKPDDAVTVTTVMDALSGVKGVVYHVIWNKCTPKVLEHYGNNPQTQEQLRLTSFGHLPHQPQNMHFIPMISGLEDAEDAMFSPAVTKELRRFIDNVAFCPPWTPADVKALNTSEADVLRELEDAKAALDKANADRIAQLRATQAAENAELERKNAAAREAMQRQVNEANAAAAAAALEAHRRHRDNGGGGGGCFPGDAMVVTRDGSLLAMRDLKAGDVVKVGRDSWEEVVGFYDLNPHATSEFCVVRYTTVPGSPCRSICLTANHMLCLRNGDILQASNLRPGMLLKLDDDEQQMAGEVTAVCGETRQGVFSPATWCGHVVVDSVLASCYAKPRDFSGVAVSDATAHLICHHVTSLLRCGWRMGVVSPEPPASQGSHPFSQGLKALSSPLRWASDALLALAPAAAGGAGGEGGAEED